MKNNKNVITFLVLTFAFLIVVLYATKSEVKTSETATPPLMTTSSPSAPSVPGQVISDYGQASLSLGNIVTFKDLSVSLLKVVDDSRCPQGVTCVWAGTANTELQISDSAGTSTQKIELGKAVTVGNQTIEIVSISPFPSKDKSISQSEYKVIVKVTPKSEVVTTASSLSCFVGGCSGEVCSDKKEGVISTCMYKEEYACYKKTTCKRQLDGSCGWTQTIKLQLCLKSVKS